LEVTPISASNGTNKIVFPSPPDRTSSSNTETDDLSSHKNNADSFGVVYANDVARRSLVEVKVPKFPVGSIIVREKLTQATDIAPQLLVVMVKRQRGFNSNAGDWEFLMIDGGLSKVLQREKSGECRNCHAKQKDQDFVFRSYLTADTRAGQK
jgi:hypothetical protein